MESSDEEGEIVADCATNYYFVDSNQNPIPFSCLPLRRNDDESEGQDDQKLESNEYAFLVAEAKNGCQKIYRKVIAWKFVLSYALPEIYVLPDAKFGSWIKLERPLKTYEDTVRTVLISVHCLHYVKNNPDEESGEALWKHIRKTFSTYEVQPSEEDLVDHMQWITEAALRDKDIAKGKSLPSVLSETSGKRKAFCEDNGTGKRAKFIVDEDDEGGDDSCDADADELFDRVCVLCDDGGDLLCCEGRCIRSFHPTIESGAGSYCESLGYSSEQVHAMQTFLCTNCQYQQHQCFICGRLGNSDKSSGAEVFPCVSATCGHFYHPLCVSELLFPLDKNKAQELQKKIQSGHSFTCPAHICSACKQGEDKNVTELQFAVCRRCPKAYHRKCLPRNISFMRDDVKNTPQRAWENLLINRILIYCMDHKICRNILTPKRDHLLFPDVDVNKKQQPTLLPPDKSIVISGRRSGVYGILTDEIKIKEQSKRITGDFINKNEKRLAGKASTLNLGLRMMFSESVSVSRWRYSNKPSLIGRIKPPLISGKPVPVSSLRGVSEKTAVENAPIERARTLKTPEMKKRIQMLINNSMSSFNVEEFLVAQRKCSNASSPLFRLDNTITMGKVECLIEALQAALKKLQDGGSIQDAKAVCEPAILSQLIKWKEKLRVYLAPFIHGMRYTSFGRHFTKVDKLEQVVSRLRWYVQDGDTIVDFCCGSNDFSCIMKEELDKMGRKCFFKNFDLIQPKNDFNFEKRDWMSVNLEELPEGSNLILGLNPPFGVHASRANQFIDKALKFKPKLIILIVPKETQRLDRKKIPYDLIWEDDHILSGKSFYLPGSVDVRDQQMEQWNLEPPPLYLWSRQDWTGRHKLVAEEHGHLDMKDYARGNAYLMEENQDCYVDGYHDINNILEDITYE